MANKHRGEVGFDFNGESFVLRYTSNSLCELEDALDMGVTEIATALANPAGVRLKTARAVFWAGLIDGRDDMTAKKAGDIIDCIGFIKALELIGKAMALAFPADDGAKANPRKPGQDGTGPVS